MNVIFVALNRTIRYRNFKVFLGLVVSWLAVAVARYQSADDIAMSGSVSAEKECWTNMFRVWEDAEHATIRERCEYEKQFWSTGCFTNSVRRAIPPLTNLVVKVAALRNGPYQCPLGGQFPDFVLHEGPSCPNGHRLPESWRKVQALWISGVRNADHLHETVTNDCAGIRDASTAWVARCARTGMISDSEARAILRNALTDSVSSVRYTALVQLGVLVRSHLEDEDALMLNTALNDIDPGIRTRAESIITTLSKKGSWTPENGRSN